MSSASIAFGGRLTLASGHSCTHTPGKFRAVDDLGRSGSDLIEPAQDFGIPLIDHVGSGRSVQALHEVTGVPPGKCQHLHTFVSTLSPAKPMRWYIGK